jgi:hypothetical protein
MLSMVSLPPLSKMFIAGPGKPQGLGYDAEGIFPDHVFRYNFIQLVGDQSRISCPDALEVQVRRLYFSPHYESVDNFRQYAVELIGVHERELTIPE